MSAARSIPDFAALVIDARSRRGLTQAQLAEAAGLTPSYLSFIENRKKPPPSDDVCRRLAEVLEIPAEQMLEVAHLERAPAGLRDRLRSLTRRLTHERRSRRRVLESLLSPFLFSGPPGYAESALDTLSIGKRRRRRIREVLDALGRKEQDKERAVSALIDELPERERERLLHALPEVLGRRPAAAEDPEAEAKPTEPADPPDAARRSATGAGEPALPFRYEAPAADEIAGSGSYLLEATAAMARGAGEVQEGDRLVVDPGLEPAPGDLVVVRTPEGARLRRLVAEAHGEEFSLDGAGAPPFDRTELAARLAEIGAGTVVEIRRPLRRGRE